MGLSFREKLGQSVKKGGLSNSELHHPSRAYERYFEGYVERAEPVPGKKRAQSVRTYVDTIFVQEQSDAKRRVFRVLFVVLYLLAVAAFVYSATRSIAANMTWFVTLPQAVTVFALGWMALGLYRYCTAPREMTVRQHRLAVTHLRRACCMAWIALAVTAAACLICAVTSPDERGMTLLCAVLNVISCACVLTVFLTERSVSYTERENPNARES